MFLAMDTVFDQCSIAIVDSAGKIISSQTETGNRQQTQQILPMIDSVLKAHQLTLADCQALIFNRGPGAFSGIRINTAVVQALSVAHDLPCVGVSSLQAIAQAAYQNYEVTDVYSALDARMQQVYFGHYCLEPFNDLTNPLSSIAMMQPVLTNLFNEISASIIDKEDPEQLLDYHSQTPLNIAIAGNGATLLTLHEGQVAYETIVPNAEIIAQLGRAIFLKDGGVEAAQALPKYLRNHAWKTLKEQGKG